MFITFAHTLSLKAHILLWNDKSKSLEGRNYLWVVDAIKSMVKIVFVKS